MLDFIYLINSLGNPAE